MTNIKGLNYSVTSYRRMLRAYVDLERTGGTKAATTLALEIGFAPDSGPGLRRACIGHGWLEVVEPPHGKSPGRLRVTEAGEAFLASGSPSPAPCLPTLPSPASAFSRTKALRALRMVADAEAAGVTVSGRDLARRLACSDAGGLEARADLIRRGWVVVQGRQSNASVLRLTEAGRLELPAAPPAPPPKEAAPMTARRRRCLCCRSEFDSEGPGNRICPSCRNTETYRSSDVGSFAVRVR